MPRLNPRRPREGQGSLFEPPTTNDSLEVDGGRHSNAMAGALEAARESDLIGEIDEGLATVLMSGAWSLDKFEAAGQSYGPSKAIQPMVEALREARMTPDSRQTQTEDKIEQLVRDLADAEATDPESTGEAHELQEQLGNGND